METSTIVEGVKYNLFETHEKLSGFWHGNYTDGYISGRGTRLSFSKNCCDIIIIGDNGLHYGGFPDSFIDISMYERDTDDTYFRGDSLQDLVDLISGKTKQWDHTVLEEINDIDTKFTQNSTSYLALCDDEVYKKFFEKGYEYVFCESPVKVVYFINKKQAILDELAKVVKYCNEQGVVWEWI